MTSQPPLTHLTKTLTMKKFYVFQYKGSYIFYTSKFFKRNFQLNLQKNKIRPFSAVIPIARRIEKDNQKQIQNNEFQRIKKIIY